MNQKIKKACSMFMASITAFSLITTVTFKNVIFAEETTGSVQEVATEDISATACAKENFTVEQVTGDVGNKETQTKDHEETTENMENATAVQTAENESTTPHELTEEEIGELNHKNTQYGIKVTSDNLPWYVKLVVEETDIQPFQDALDNGDVEYAPEYYQDIDWEDEDIEDEDFEQSDYDEDMEDEDYDEDTEDDIDQVDYDEEDFDEENYDEDDIEDELVDDSDWDDEYDEDEEYDYPQDKMIIAYKISFFDTKENKEYAIPENEKINISIDTDNENYTITDETYNLEEYRFSMLKMLENGSVEILYNENSTYDNEYDEESIDGEDVEETATETDNVLPFYMTESGEYGIALLANIYWTTSKNSDIGIDDAQTDVVKKSDKISPKTGIRMDLLWGVEAVSILLMSAAAANLIRRKKEEK